MLTVRNFTLFFEKIGPRVALIDDAAAALSAMTDAMVKKTQMGLMRDANLVATFPAPDFAYLYQFVRIREKVNFKPT